MKPKFIDGDPGEEGSEKPEGKNQKKPEVRKSDTSQNKDSKKNQNKSGRTENKNKKLEIKEIPMTANEMVQYIIEKCKGTKNPDLLRVSKVLQMENSTGKKAKDNAKFQWRIAKNVIDSIIEFFIITKKI